MPNVQNQTATSHKDLMNRVRQFITGYGTFPTPGFAGVGDGTISDVNSPPPSLSETWTILCTLGGGTGVATFSVTGSVSGVQAVATVGEFYETAGKLFEFLIKDGPIDFVIADVFTVVITEGAMITAGQEWAQDRWVPHPNDILTGNNFDVPRLLFNGVANLFVLAAVRLGQTTATLQFSLDDATEFDQYVIAAQSQGFLVANMPLDWTLEWSDDLTGPWTIADTVVGFSAWIGGTEHNFPLTSPGRHFNWRMVITNNNGGVDVDIGYFEAQVTGDVINSLTEGHVLFTGQGLAGGDVIPVGMSIKEDVTIPYFNWRLKGAIAFEPTEPFQNQPSASPSTFFVVDDGLMVYWIVATGRYFIVIVKIGSVYFSMMMGFMLPYGSPSEYGFPLVIAGTLGTFNAHFTLQDNRLRMFPNPGASAMLVRLPGGSWATFINFNNAGTNDFQATGPRLTTPWAGPFTATTTLMLDKIVEGIDGSYPLTPVVLAELEGIQAGGDANDRNAYGELEGVFHISGSNQTSENTLVIGGDTYLVIQDVYRLAFENFMAVRLDP